MARRPEHGRGVFIWIYKEDQRIFLSYLSASAFLRFLVYLLQKYFTYYAQG